MTDEEYGPKKPDEYDYIMNDFKNGKGKTWKPLSADNWREELNQIPLFMDRAPTPEEIENNPTLQAIQSLVYDGTPDEIASNFKEQGNEIVRAKLKNQYPEAIKYYTRALEQQCNDKNLNISCLLNRAAVNLDLENYRSVVMDCTRALKEETIDTPLQVKAFYRLSKALVALERFDAAFSCIDRGLELDPSNEALAQFLKQAMKKLKNSQDKLEKLEKKMQEDRDKEIRLIEALKVRNVTICGNLTLEQVLSNGNPEMALSNCWSPARLFSLPHGFDYKPTLAEQTGTIEWPVILIYPQLETFDVMSEWNETISINDQLEHVLDDRQDLSTASFNYLPDTVAVYMPTAETGWKRVKVLSNVQEVVSQFPLASDMVLRLWIVPRLDCNSSNDRMWTKEWLKGRNK